VNYITGQTMGMTDPVNVTTQLPHSQLNILSEFSANISAPFLFIQKLNCNKIIHNMCFNLEIFSENANSVITNINNCVVYYNSFIQNNFIT
jgi:hypothetical protein